MESSLSSFLLSLKDDDDGRDSIASFYQYPANCLSLFQALSTESGISRSSQMILLRLVFAAGNSQELEVLFSEINVWLAAGVKRSAKVEALQLLSRLELIRQKDNDVIILDGNFQRNIQYIFQRDSERQVPHLNIAIIKCYLSMT